MMKDGDLFCVGCTNVVTRSEVLYRISLDGTKSWAYCPRCFENSFIRCANCGKPISLPSEQYIMNNISTVCRDCYYRYSIVRDKPVVLIEPWIPQKRLVG